MNETDDQITNYNNYELQEAVNRLTKIGDEAGYKACLEAAKADARLLGRLDDVLTYVSPAAEIFFRQLRTDIRAILDWEAAQSMRPVDDGKWCCWENYKDEDGHLVYRYATKEAAQAHVDDCNDGLRKHRELYPTRESYAYSPQSGYSVRRLAANGRWIEV